jgi:hypothetical protein
VAGVAVPPANEYPPYPPDGEAPLGKTAMKQQRKGSVDSQAPNGRLAGIRSRSGGTSETSLAFAQRVCTLLDANRHAEGSYFAAPSEQLYRALPPDPLAASEGTARLNRAEQLDLLRQFWSKFYDLASLVDEQAFMASFERLWSPSAAKSDLERLPCGLADIILALSLQVLGGDHWRWSKACHGPNGLGREFAGFSLYRRSSFLTAGRIEDPSIETVQVHLLSAIYLQSAALWGKAYESIGIAVRQAYLLGLPLPQTTEVSKAERCIRKRLWYLTAAIDIEQHLKLGYALAIQLSDITESEAGRPPTCKCRECDYLLQLLTVRKLTLLAHYQQAPSGNQSQDDEGAGIEHQALHDKALLGWTEGLSERWSASSDDGEVRINRFGSPEIFWQHISLDLWLSWSKLSLTRPSVGSTPVRLESQTAPHARTAVQEAQKIVRTLNQVHMKTDLLREWYDAHFLLSEALFVLLGCEASGAMTTMGDDWPTMMNTAVAILDFIGTGFAQRVLMAVREMISRLAPSSLAPSGSLSDTDVSMMDFTTTSNAISLDIGMAKEAGGNYTEFGPDFDFATLLDFAPSAQPPLDMGLWNNALEPSWLQDEPMIGAPENPKR